MKFYLIDPTKKWCKANLHCHTCHSDGFYTPEQIKKIYMKRGYQIVAFSDHELIFDNSYLTDENFVAITATEYSLNDINNPANSTYVEKDSKKILWRDIHTIHICLFSKDPHNTFHFATSEQNITPSMVEKYQKYAHSKIEYDGYFRQLTPESAQETIDRANGAGFLVQFNHPNWSLNTRDVYINLKGLWGFEILNYATELESGSEYCPNLYDDMVRYGHKEVCTMNDDNHNHGGSLEDSFGGFNYIGVKKLTYKDVIDAMEKGDIYCSNGPTIESLYIDTDQNKIFVKCSKAQSIMLIGYNRTFRHVYGKNLTEANFDINGREIYFRICVRDKNGKTAHTHAYLLNDYINK